ncbi:hypothetical protein [Lactiplantibacillus pentosus]|uniref:hypothetical protein n=1 Tax=Lactiplantibacillus pentosus TaxID=1589 RepID=UPI0037704388
MHWAIKAGIGVLVSAGSFTAIVSQPTHASAATYRRTAATKVASKPYYTTSNTGKTYTFSGSLKKTKMHANHALKSYHNSTWTRTKQAYVYKGNRKVRYYYVKSAKNGATGWVASSYLKAGKDYQAKTAKKTTASAYDKVASHTGKIYQISGTNNYVKLKAKTSLNANLVYTRTKTRVIYKRGRAYTYNYVTAGSTHGWAVSGDIVSESSIGKTKVTSKANGLTSYATSGNVLSPYRSQDFSTVNSSGYTMGKITYTYDSDYSTTNSFQTAVHTLPLTKSTNDAYSKYHFQTAVYLPIDYPGFSRKSILGNPQSAAFSKDDHYLYVMYNDNQQASDENQTGWVIRYDWTKLNQLLNASGSSLSMIRRATNRYYRGTTTALDRQVLACMKVGPQFKAGHVQSLALNPKTNQLWFIKAYKNSTTATVQRLSMSTLKPNAIVNFTLKSTVHMGSVLSFDNSGNAYFWTQTKSAWPTAPVNSVKFYKGTLGVNRVHFSLVKQGLSQAPGQVLQSMSYNSNNGRLYLVSDESIFSVPANKLGKLSTADVSRSNFSGKREFEGLVWQHTSNTGYLLTNKGPELMKVVAN